MFENTEAKTVHLGAGVVVDGDVDDRDATVPFRHKGRDLAIVTVRRDLASLQAERTMKRALKGDAAGSSL